LSNRAEDFAMTTRSGREGFSMIELTVAMLITLIISGAIYGMLASSQASFRREPALAERQQNIRVAMDMIVRDLMGAGGDVPAGMQVFSRGMNGAGCLTTGCTKAISPSGTGTQKTDIIQFFGNGNGDCPSLETCKGGGSSLDLAQLVPACYHLPGPVLLWTKTAGPGCPDPNPPSPIDQQGPIVGPPCAVLMWACLPGNGQNKACGGGQGGANGHTTFPHGQAPNYNPRAARRSSPSTCRRWRATSTRSVSTRTAFPTSGARTWAGWT